MKRVILLADDSPTIQRLVPQIFADNDFEVVSVSNGDAAVRKFEEIHPDIVLADIYMPGKNGYEVCEFIRKHAELGQTPVILLAGAFDVFDADTARQIGASAHITKPFEPHALVNLVTSLVSDRASGEQEPQPAAPPPSTESIPAPGIPMGIPMKLETEVETSPPEATAVAAAAPLPVYSLETEAAPAPDPELVPLTVPEPVMAAAVIEEPEPLAVPAPSPAPAPESAPAPASASTPPPVSAPSSPPAARTDGDGGDVLGLNDIFKPAAGSVSEEEIERIANRVIQKLSTQVIESVAWDVVPEITTKVLRDELKRQS